MVSTFAPDLKRSFPLFLVEIKIIRFESWEDQATIQKIGRGSNAEIEGNHEKTIAEVHVSDIKLCLWRWPWEWKHGWGNMDGPKVYLEGQIDRQQIGLGGGERCLVWTNR